VLQHEGHDVVAVDRDPAAVEYAESHRSSGTARAKRCSTRRGWRARTSWSRARITTR
jgi:hypothetical protein